MSGSMNVTFSRHDTMKFLADVLTSRITSLVKHGVSCWLRSVNLTMSQRYKYFVVSKPQTTVGYGQSRSAEEVADYAAKAISRHICNSASLRNS